MQIDDFKTERLAYGYAFGAKVLVRRRAPPWYLFWIAEQAVALALLSSQPFSGSYGLLKRKAALLLQ